MTIELQAYKASLTSSQWRFIQAYFSRCTDMWCMDPRPPRPPWPDESIPKPPDWDEDHFAELDEHASRPDDHDVDHARQRVDADVDRSHVFTLARGVLALLRALAS